MLLLVRIIVFSSTVPRLFQIFVLNRGCARIPRHLIGLAVCLLQSLSYLRGVRAGERHAASNHAALFGVPELISLKSEWFLNGKQMPLRSAGMGVGENISPPLSWNGVPAGTVELAIIMEDPDAPLPRPFVHMVVYRISPDKSSVAEGAFAHEDIGVAFGRSTAGAQGYLGPRPVPGHGHIATFSRYSR